MQIDQQLLEAVAKMQIETSVVGLHQHTNAMEVFKLGYILHRIFDVRLISQESYHFRLMVKL